MIYVSTCICVVLFVLWSFIFIKTYQLNGYNIKLFLSQVLRFNLSFGDKSKFNFTKRMIRMFVVLVLFSFAIFFLFNYFIDNVWIILLCYALTFILSPLFIIISHYFLFPIEVAIKHFYMSKAKRKLAKKDIIKIGITGSYGKTSTKNILTAILEKNFKVCSTPKNYNTEMGITKAVLENLDDHDVFIAEMGARHQGDIQILTKMVKPSFGILTTIGKQHIETFGSIENIERTKNELPLNLTKDGVMIFNGDSPSNIKLYHEFKGQKYLACHKNGFSYARNISIDCDGSRFEMIIDKKVFPIKTRLLGKCNIDNIVTASTLAYIIGINKEDIVSAISSLEPTPHRLELIKNNYSVIIDDSYNSNIIGSREALDVLAKFEGKKIVVTPGLVEMGSEQSEANFKLGGYIADVADYIVIMNETNKNYLLSGAISHNFNKNNIFFCNTRKKQKEILQKLMTKGCVVLFENDLPDNYK